MAYDTREVTMVLKEDGKSTVEKPLFRRAGFNLVKYDGDPDRYIEPVNACLSVDTLDSSADVMQTPAKVERIDGFEYYAGRYGEAIAFPPDFVSVT